MIVMNNLDIKFTSRPVLEIDLDALADNYRHLKNLAHPAKVAASVKADAYGLGANRVSQTLYNLGCRTFFVAHALEGAALRDVIPDNAEIYVFCGPLPGDIDTLFKNRLKPVINSVQQAQVWQEFNQEQATPLPAALHFDTGINRLGIPIDEQNSFFDGDFAFPTDLILSHLACSPMPDDPHNPEQLKRFKAIAAHYPQTRKSLANSGGLYLGPQYRFDLIRCGIGLFGGKASFDPAADSLKPVASLHAPVLQTKTVKAGESLGYNATAHVTRDSQIAVVGIGYADGLPLSASGSDTQPGLRVRIHDQMAPVIGRVSMDMTLIDITDIAVKAGDMAVFFGPDLSDQADHAQTIDYEILTRLGARSERRYLQSG